MKTNDEKFLKEIYSNVQTPQYDATHDVLKHIHKAPRKSIALRRVLVVALILCLIAAALGAAKLLVVKMVNFDGEITTFAYQPNPITPTSTPETVPENIYIGEEHEFTRAAEPGELRMVIDLTDSSALCNIPSIDTTDINTALEYADNSYIPFVFPQYIPEGYEFSDGGVEFFIGEDSINAELTYSETRDDKLYEIYLLPEDYEKNIILLSLHYLNDEDERLTYTAFVLEGEYVKNSLDIGLTETQSAKTISLSGFEKCLVITDSSEDAYSKNKVYFYNYMESVNAISNFPYLMHTEALPEGADTELVKYYTYSAVLYNISAQTLSEEEVIKIAESIN